ncbi:MAG: ATP-binding cassette domain-containing protein [Clostridia bacterium]|nr:ATP-binding cassette domain-containing protein [Clostridia bacterium]MBQ7289160.1 ATP-binding cassette domain-containing protein [Clostridia bacterium]
MISLQKVCFSYGENTVLRDFDLTLHAGQTLCLYGPSGCGKTTVLRLIAGLITPDSGSVSVKGKVSMVFQEDRLVPYLTIKENLLAVAEHSDVLQTLGLGEYENANISDLSGGMARRVAIARAISYGGDILLLDEPFNGLDEKNKQIAAAQIKKHFKGKCIVMVSHQKEDIALMDAEIFAL